MATIYYCFPTNFKLITHNLDSYQDWSEIRTFRAKRIAHVNRRPTFIEDKI